MTPPAPSPCQSHIASCGCWHGVGVDNAKWGCFREGHCGKLPAPGWEKNLIFPEGSFSEQSTLTLGKDLSPPRLGTNPSMVSSTGTCFCRMGDVRKWWEWTPTLTPPGIWVEMLGFAPSFLVPTPTDCHLLGSARCCMASVTLPTRFYFFLRDYF